MPEVGRDSGMTEARKEPMWWLLGMEKVRDRWGSGREGRTAQKTLGIISITTRVFLSSRLFVCLSPFPLPSPSPPGLMNRAKLGLSSPSTISSTLPVYSIPQRCHQKPMTLWGKQLRAARGPSGSLGPALGLPQTVRKTSSAEDSLREWPKDSLPSTRPEAWLALTMHLGCSAPSTVRRRWSHSYSPARGRNSGTESRSD